MNLTELTKKAPPEEHPALLMAAIYHMGRGYPSSLAAEVVHRARNQQPPITPEIAEYHGAMESQHRTLQRLGTRRFGPPPVDTARAIYAIEDLERLCRMTYRLFDAVSWEDLLGTP